MARFNISLVAVNDHHLMYEELSKTLAAGLVTLGHVCTIAMNQFDPDAINIVVGSTIFAARHLQLTEKLRGKFYIVYQLEQLDDAHGLLREWPEYKELLGNAASIWDYAPSSTAFLRSRGFPRVAYLPPGYHSCIDTFRPATEPAYDIVFLGTPHPRRSKLLDALGAEGCRIRQMFGIYGAARNAVIGAGRIVLNIHAWDDLNFLETIRLSLLLANHCFVISETSDHNPYHDGVVYADYDALKTTCLDYLKRPSADRIAVAERGAAILKTLPMTELMRPIVAESLALT